MNAIDKIPEVVYKKIVDKIEKLANEKPTDIVGCFDSFIFKSPINIDYSLINHIQNRPGSEHVFKTIKTDLGKYGSEELYRCQFSSIIFQVFGKRNKSCQPFLIFVPSLLVSLCLWSLLSPQFCR